MINRVNRKRRDAKKSKKRNFVYTPPSEKTLKERAEQTGGRFDSPYKQGFDVFRPKVGDNILRILPATWEGHDHYGYDVWMHRYIGPDNSTYVCRRKMLNKPCAACEAAREAKDAGETDEAKALEPAKVVVVWALDRSEDNDTAVVWPMSWTMDRDVTALCQNKRTGKMLILDNPDEGFDISFKRQGQGLKTRYFGLAIDRDPSPVADDEDKQDEILEYIWDNPIPEILDIKENKYLEAVLAGQTEEADEDEDEEDEDEPRKGKGKAKGKGKSRRTVKARDEEEEDEDPDEDEDEEEEDEDDNPVPRTSTSGRKRTVVDEDEDEEGDDDELDEKDTDEDEDGEDEDEDPDEDEDEEEEDEPAPKRRGRPVSSKRTEARKPAKRSKRR